MMNKIFLSHSSKDAKIAEAFKTYLFNIGVDIDNDLYFTSNNDTGIALGNDVLTDIHNELTNAKIVILLLSKNYYSSAYCMNEMGATWILNKAFIPFILPEIENQTMVGVIGNNKQYGVINKSVLNTFYDKHIKDIFTKRNRPTNEIENARDIFISIATQPTTKHEINANNSIMTSVLKPKPDAKVVQYIDKKKIEDTTNPIDELIVKGFTNIEKLFIKYIIDTERVKFMCGWQENNEIEKIKVWEELTGLLKDTSSDYYKGPLSNKYSNVLQKFEIRKLIEVSAVTSSNNPKEYKLKEGIFDNITNLNSTSLEELNMVLQQTLSETEDGLPF